MLFQEQTVTTNTTAPDSSQNKIKGKTDKILKVIDAFRGASQGSFFGYAAINSTYKAEGHGFDVGEAALSVGGLELALAFLSLCILSQSLAFKRYPCSISNIIKLLCLMMSIGAAIGLLAATVYDQFGERPNITIVPEKFCVIFLSVNLAFYRAISEVSPLKNQSLLDVSEEIFSTEPINSSEHQPLLVP